MKTSNHRTQALTLLLLAVASLPASAQLSTTANGPYYATPSWNQKLATNRFVVLANWNGEAVLDRETGLVWETTSGPPFATWFEASFRCIGLTKGGRAGWRLPTVQDLQSLTDPAKTGSPPTIALPQGHPFSPVSPYYWSATDRAMTSSTGPLAWAVSFVGHPVSVEFKANTTVGQWGVGSWCVRGGPATGAQ